MNIIISLSEKILKKLRIKGAKKDMSRKAYIEEVLIKDSEL